MKFGIILLSSLDTCLAQPTGIRRLIGIAAQTPTFTIPGPGPGPNNYTATEKPHVNHETRVNVMDIRLSTGQVVGIIIGLLVLTIVVLFTSCQKDVSEETQLESARSTTTTGTSAGRMTRPSPVYQSPDQNRRQSWRLCKDMPPPAYSLSPILPQYATQPLQS